MTIALRGNWYHIRVGRRVIRALGDPGCICLRVNEKMDSIAFMPCADTDPMSFRIPDAFYTDSKVMIRIYCKEFVQSFLSRNGLDPDTTYVLYGHLSERNNAVLFSVTDPERIKVTSGKMAEFCAY